MVATQSQATSTKDDAQLHKDDSGHSSPRSEGIFYSYVLPEPTRMPDLYADSPLPDSRLPNGNSLLGPSGRPRSWGSINWANGPTGGAVAGLGKPPPGRDPKSRARSRDFLKQLISFISVIQSFLRLVRCLQEITYLTSPQAMNPLPNRPLLNNASVPLPLPNPVEQMGFNGRPRKVLLEAGKDYPSVNGIAPAPGTSSTAAPGPQLSLLDRSAGGLLQPSQNVANSSLQSGAGEKDRGEDLESRQSTAIFRPDEDGEWKEKLRSEQAKQLRDGQAAAVSPWDRRRDDDDDVRDEEPEIDDDESTMVSDGETTKTWKAKRTLRKSVV